MNVYKYQNYRKFIHEWVETKGVQEKLTFAKIARQSRLQPSYLTNVLKGRAGLNTDQIYDVAKVFGLSEPEAIYLELLVEIDRCHIPSRRRRLESQRRALQAKHLRSSELLGVKSATESVSSSLAEYYGDPYVPLVHIALSIAALREKPERLYSQLRISKERYEQIVGVLKKMRLVAEGARGLDVIQGSVHLDERSVLHRMHGTLARQLACDALNRSTNDSSTFFSAAFSCDPESLEKVRQLWQKFLQDFSQVVRSGESKALYQINFDLFEHR